MRLHWSPRSPFVRKVMVLAHETGLVDRLETVRTVVAMSATNVPLLADNPLGKIPTLVLDDGTCLYDSVVICEYLDSLHNGPKLFPTDATRWVALRRHALGTGWLDLLILWRNSREQPVPPKTWIDGFVLKNDATLAALEAEAPALGDGPITIGHVAIGCALAYLNFRFADMGWRNGRPALSAWFDGFAARPSMLATEAVDA
ncbi:glutathione S-transferase [Humitalea sp. 24SJ18S-53]|uniref:glutathione S-transferase n=1 Tax=Humitalea sp. 24SJ18S-53 TaxID=3422307 RepID=UPI003D67D042